MALEPSSYGAGDAFALPRLHLCAKVGSHARGLVNVHVLAWPGESNQLQRGSSTQKRAMPQRRLARCRFRAHFALTSAKHT